MIITMNAFETRRIVRLHNHEIMLREQINRYAEPVRSQYITLMRVWLDTPSGSFDKHEIGGRLNTLGLAIWRLTPDRATAFLDTL